MWKDTFPNSENYFVPTETCFTDFISFGLYEIILIVLTAILLRLNASSDRITVNPGMGVHACNPGMLEAGTRGTCQFEFQLGLPIETLS